MRKRLTGTVTSDKMSKSRRVEIQRLQRHPKYGKIVRGRTICYMHDEENVTRTGDVVEIVEGRPRSRLKRWDLVRVVKPVGGVEAEAAKVHSAGEASTEQSGATAEQQS